jgi:hypothetical protein
MMRGAMALDPGAAAASADHRPALGGLAADAIAGLAGVVEAMHLEIARVPVVGRLGPPAARGVAGLVYRSIREIASIVGAGVDTLFPPGDADRPRSVRREALRAALNGVVGDHLAATGNALAIPMRLRRGGRPLSLERRALAAAIPRPGRRVLLLVHGSCLSDLAWRRGGHDHGAALARALGYTAVYLHYNTGLHVSRNGQELDALLERLVESWPVKIEALDVVAHSMGGLVARSACHHGAASGRRWVRALRRVVFLGTPHHGAPLERGGSWLHLLLQVSRHSAPLARLGALRSAGVTDLRHGSLLDRDWAGRDRLAPGRDARRPVPLPAGVSCHAVAASLAGGTGLAARLVGDGLVPIDSALGRHRDPARTLAFGPGRTWIANGMGHFDLLARREVCRVVERWLR